MALSLLSAFIFLQVSTNVVFAASNEEFKALVSLPTPPSPTSPAIKPPSLSYKPPSLPITPIKPPTLLPSVKPSIIPVKPTKLPVKPYPAPSVKPPTTPPVQPPMYKPPTPTVKPPTIPPVNPIPSPPVNAPPANPPVKPPTLPPVRPRIDCVPLCGRRCDQHSRKNVCMRACVTCCYRCKCVPPGTYGNKEKCGSCYANMKTSGGRPKCP